MTNSLAAPIYKRALKHKFQAGHPFEGSGLEAYFKTRFSLSQHSFSMTDAEVFSLFTLHLS